MRDIGVLKYGSRERPNSIKWWAELGRIHYQNDDTGEYGSLSRREFLERLWALNNLNKKGGSVNNMYDAQERIRIMRAVEQGLELVKKAKLQGDPDDRAVARARKEAIVKPFMVSNPAAPKLILPASYPPEAPASPTGDSA